MARASETMYTRDHNRNRKNIMATAIRSFDSISKEDELEFLIESILSLSNENLESAVRCWLTLHDLYPKINNYEKECEAIKDGKTTKHMAFCYELDELIRKHILENAPSIHDAGWAIDDPL